jgi:poly(3-hydroxybutyrate) depolymerase
MKMPKVLRIRSRLVSPRQGRPTRIGSAALAVAALLMAAPAAAAAATGESNEGGGTLSHHEFGVVNGTLYEYHVYTPVGWRGSDRLPLYMVLNGCGVSAAEMMEDTGLNTIADRERFIVAYADNEGAKPNCWPAVAEDAVLTASTGNPNLTRGAGGAADIVAGMTTQILEQYHGNKHRVYLAGGSSGAFQASATAAAYPELYAAVGLVAGAGPGMAVTCMNYSTAVVADYAALAVTAMGTPARVVPFITFGGTLDPLGEQPGDVGGCSGLGYQQWLAMANLVKPGSFYTDPAATEHGQVVDGYAWTKEVAKNRQSGCEIGQRWIIEGMGHAWPGPQGDQRGPDAAQLSWDFFEQFMRNGASVSCRASGAGAE